MSIYCSLVNFEVNAMTKLLLHRNIFVFDLFIDVTVLPLLNIAINYRNGSDLRMHWERVWLAIYSIPVSLLFTQVSLVFTLVSLTSFPG